jgi:nucleoside phosphorylase
VPRASAHRPVAVILTALDVETKAIVRQVPKWKERVIDGTVFYVGPFGRWDMAVAEVGPGNSTVAAVAQRAIHHFLPTVALFVGVAGGVKDVEIGDVVVADKVYGYDSGKEDGTGFRPRPVVQNSAHDIEQRGRALPKSSDWLKRLDRTPDKGKEPRVFVGPIASGERVVASTRSATAVFLQKQYSDALAIDMEGHGFLAAVGINNNVLGGVVRGISDLLSGKTEADESGSQPLAADAASAAAFEILHAMRRPQRTRSKRKPPKTPRGGGPAKLPVSKEPVAPTAMPDTEEREKKPLLETPSTFSKAAYFGRTEVLAKIGVPDVDEVSFSYVEPPDAYLRIIPAAARARPLPLATLRDAANHAPLLRQQLGGLATINRYGAIAYDPGATSPRQVAPLHRSTQLFQNGELWATSNTMIIRQRGGRPHWLPLPFLPALLFERLFYEKLHAAIAFAQTRLDLTFPFQVELGLINTHGMYLGITNEDIRGPVQANETVYRLALANADTETINSALLEFFNQVHDLTGYQRPIGLYSFPPGPPRQ